ncbi:hypothetical protein CRUP_021249 [Coryphaenoides rupestris]|nr:hypothetical protein CRUP_021249 [Coryphaenoides rupestris]
MVSIKTFGDRSKDVKRRPRFQEFPPQFTAGLELLSRYEESWVLLHRRTKDCAQNAEVSHLEGDFEEMESRLAYLETLCCQCDQQRLKQHHINQLEKYKKKKRQELEALKEELDSDHARRVAELEQATQNKLRERQKVHEEAFKHDMARYLSTGYLQLQEANNSQEGALDQLMVTDTSDQQALDDFLNSSANGAGSISSSLTSGSARVSASHTHPADEQDDAFGHSEELGSEDSDIPLGQSDEDDIPLVQSDEEDIQADALLAVLPEDGLPRSSDETWSRLSDLTKMTASLLSISAELRLTDVLPVLTDGTDLIFINLPDVPSQTQLEVAELLSCAEEDDDTEESGWGPSAWMCLARHMRRSAPPHDVPQGRCRPGGFEFVEPPGTVA